MDKPFKIKYPPLINEQALYIGKMREATNVYMHQKNPKFKRGNIPVDALGCQCELIAQYYCWDKKLSYESDQMLGGKPIASYDIKVTNPDGEIFKIDVKGISAVQGEFRVNYNAHIKDKNISHYMFIQPLSENLFNEDANIWIKQKKEIDKWDLKELKYSKAYIKQMLFL
jgi:hypothetical protein